MDPDIFLLDDEIVLIIMAAYLALAMLSSAIAALKRAG